MCIALSILPNTGIESATSIGAISATAYATKAGNDAQTCRPGFTFVISSPPLYQTQKLKGTQPNMGDPNTGEIYQGAIRESEHVGLDELQARELKDMDVENRKAQLQEMAQARDAAKPDLRTLEGALSYLDYHAPNDDTLPRHIAVNTHFQLLVEKIWNVLPDGPGKTVAIRAIGRARMECNSCIANGGQ